MRNSPRPIGWIAASLGLGLLFLWLLVAQLPGRSLLRPLSASPVEAEWIWSDGPRDRRSPVAFYALRDFELDELEMHGDPAGEADLSAAFLEITADEEYDAFLNGHRLGSGRLSSTGRVAFDRWPAAFALRQGTNRLTVEVRSARGAGGLLARLVDGEGHSRLSTDHRWRISRRAQRGLVGGWQPLDRTEPAVVWGPPPVGRWGRVEGVVPRPAPPLDSPLYEPRRGRLLGPDQPWFDLAKGPPVRRVQRAIPGAVFDFGEEVSGHLHLGLGGTDLRCALVRVGPRPADPFATEEDFAAEQGLMIAPAALGEDPGADSQDVEQVPVVLVTGAQHWRDTVARKFRYVTVLGSVGGVVAWVEGAPVDELNPLHSSPGLGVESLGIRPPRLRTPIEDEVGRELKRFPSLTGGEDL